MFPSGDWRQSFDALTEWHDHEVHGAETWPGPQTLPSYWETQTNEIVAFTFLVNTHPPGSNKAERRFTRCLELKLPWGRGVQHADLLQPKSLLLVKSVKKQRLDYLIFWKKKRQMQPLTIRFDGLHEGGVKLQPSTDFSTSDYMMLRIYRQWWRKLNPKGFHCVVYITCSGTVNTHRQLHKCCFSTVFYIRFTSD